MDTDNLKSTIELDQKGWPTKQWLEQAYLEKGLSTLAIAKVTGRSSSKICALMKRYDIPMRRPVEISREWLEQKYVVERLSLQEIVELSGARNKDQIIHFVKKFGFAVRRPRPILVHPTRESLQRYIEEGLTTKQICGITGYGRSGLIQILHEYGIEPNGKARPQALQITRDELYQLHVVEGLTAVRIAARLGCHNSAVSRLIKRYSLDPGRPLVNEKKVPPLTRDELWKLYWVDLLSTGEIAEQFGVARSTALRWFKHFDVPTREWNGGKDFHRTYIRTTGDRREYEFNAIEREQILNRDGWQCRMPGCHCKEAWRLEVHHILPIEYGGTNALDNGITLCRDCHDSIRRRELDFIPIFREILNTSSKQLVQAQTDCIGGTPEKQVNTEATNPKGAESVTSIRQAER